MAVSVSVAPFAYYGNKSRIAQELQKLIPEHRAFIEVFGGSGSLLLSKTPSKIEIYNDLDGSLVNFFRVLRDTEKTRQLQHILKLTPYGREEYSYCKQHRDDGDADTVERARRFFVSIEQSFSGTGTGGWSHSKSEKVTASFRKRAETLEQFTDRLAGVQIENLHFRDILRKYDNADTLFYLDPPYVPASRKTGNDYRYEMAEADHEELLSLILQSKSKIILSGYASTLYDNALKDWHRKEIEVVCNASKERSKRTEVVWMNYQPGPGDLSLFPEPVGLKSQPKAAIPARSPQKAPHTSEGGLTKKPVKVYRTVSSDLGGVFMGFKGTVGPVGQCPKCRKPFEFVNLETGYICRKHLTTPSRYRIVAKSMGVPTPLYSDKLGNTFDSWQLVINQWTSMNTAWTEAQQPKGKRFIPDDWIPGKVREQEFRFKALNYIERKRPLFDRGKLTKSRWNALNNIVNEFLTPHFKDKDIRAIDKDDLQAFYLSLLDKKMESGEKYADSYISEILAVLKSIFLEYRSADMPEFPKMTVVAKREKQRLGFERQMRIEPHIPVKYRLAVRTIITTGMRTGELQALQVNDLVDGSLMVWKAISDGKLKLARKSGGEVSYRVDLGLWQDLQASTGGKQPSDFIFTNDGVNPLGKKCLYKVWMQACKDAKVKYITLQQASRHSMASQVMADAKRKAIEEIQRKLGHHNKKTQKHYIIE